ncbi:hypothetical protein LTS07_008945 [Exophiala sideris]|uniref:Uncharacterized protein n=1 Tax=Exophiala sideris TaxID=1016849 RepID=A0ABR0J199_9EURO|nr:hypothetical protein LTS07_008945 [Exophiala sideris]KAK5030161.1 hypothetical protein LTR13_008474 [Exophiala sideris]KAK5053656.1 hypothetical protein LTR69_009301 [Exophiala sideris]KAK5179301.1 hypothetical protein LTR44_008139 [Eurotiomycetes sp. CCFEE 6388]
MNATRQIISRRAMSLTPRLGTSARFASTHAHGAQMSKHEQGVMRSVFTAATVATASGVAYAAARSGGRVGGRYAQKNSKLDSPKWFMEGAEGSNVFGKH